MSSTASVGGSNSAYATSTSRRIDRLVSRADQNGDGQISLSEFSAIGQNLPGNSATSSTAGSATTAATGSATAAGTDRSALFSQIDANGDGQLSTDELSTYKQQQVTAARTALLNIQEAFGGGSDGGGRTDGAGGTGRAHHGHHHRASQAATDAGADASTDGLGDAATTSAGTSTTASASAGTDPVSAFFGAVDANSDGAISKAELSSFVTQLFSRLGSATQGGASAANASTATTGATA